MLATLNGLHKDRGHIINGQYKDASHMKRNKCFLFYILAYCLIDLSSLYSFFKKDTASFQTDFEGKVLRHLC
jgi:hypothetical protein